MTTAAATPTTRPAHRIYLVRAGVALVWAALLTIAVAASDSVSAHAALPAVIATLLVLYPLIDTVATGTEAFSLRRAGGALSTAQLVNAVISLAAAIALAVAADHGADAVLRVFGAWAILSGLVQLGLGLVRRRSTAGQWPMILAGGISVLAGSGFVQMASHTDPTVGNLAGYAVLGAIFFLVSARRQSTRRA